VVCIALKIIEIVATWYHILRLKGTKFDFGCPKFATVRSTEPIGGAPITLAANYANAKSSAADCYILFNFCREFDHVTLHVLDM